MIYRSIWKPASVGFDPHGSRRATDRRYGGESPVTLSINIEARKETLRYYQAFSYLYSGDLGFPRLFQGWINPYIDTLHITRIAVTFMKSLQFHTLREPLLLVIVEPPDYPTTGMYLSTFEGLRSRCYPELSSLVKVMDFLTTQGRYRVCRTTIEQTLALIKWENAGFQAAIGGHREETRTSRLHPDDVDINGICRTWEWQYDPSSSHLITSPRSSTISPEDAAYLPNPNLQSNLRLPAAVSHFFDGHASDHFRQHCVVVFDNDPPTSIQHNKEERWAFIKVIPWLKEFSHEEVVNLAFDNMFHFRPVDGSPPPGQSGSFEEAIDMFQPPPSRFGPVRRGQFPASGKVVHGVCAPDFCFPPGEAGRELEDDEGMEDCHFEKNMSYFQGRDGFVHTVEGMWHEVLKEDEE